MISLSFKIVFFLSHSHFSQKSFLLSLFFTKLPKIPLFLLNSFLLYLSFFHFIFFSEFNIFSKAAIGWKDVYVCFGWWIGHKERKLEIQVCFRIECHIFCPFGFHVAFNRLEIFFSKTFKLFKSFIRFQDLLEPVHIFFFQFSNMPIKNILFSKLVTTHKFIIWIICIATVLWTK